MARLAALGCMFFGLLLAALALKSPWFVLPCGWDAEGLLETRDTAVTKLFKIGLAIELSLLVAVAIWLFWKKDWRNVCGWVFCWSVGVAPLFWWYPQWVVVQDAETSGDAAWLQQQHDNMTWLGGDLFRAHSERYNDSQLVVNMQDPPLYLAAFKTPMDSLATLGIEEIPEVIWWFGLNPAFAQFVGTGWFLSWLGPLLAGMGAFGVLKGLPGKGRSKLLQRAAIILLLSSLAVTVSALYPVMKASQLMRTAKNHVLEGQWSDALVSLENAQKWMPSLKFDTSVILQRGRLEHMLGKKTPRAMLYEVFAFEIEGYGARAKEVLWELEKKRPDLPRELSRELSRSWMRVTIDDFNSGRVSEAKKQFSELCLLEPISLQARFHYQLTCLQTGDLEGNRKCQFEIAELYRPFLRKEKKGLLATSWWMLSQGELQAGNTVAAAEARRQSKGL